jgi:hypothetical protein
MPQSLSHLIVHAVFSTNVPLRAVSGSFFTIIATEILGGKHRLDGRFEELGIGSVLELLA